jgi:hypothetical protein
MNYKVNFHYITDNEYIGYGMASKNMLDAFKKINNIDLSIVKAGEKSKIFSKDFFLRPPPWISNSSRKKIAYFYWETDKLPVPWANSLRTADEIWAPCELVRDVCIRAGYKGQIKIIPTPHKPWDIKFSGQILDPEISKDTFVFYSIFQWHTRKGWRELLTSYWNEFKKDDDVVLVLKVNSIHGIKNDNQIKKDIIELKNSLNLTYYPKIYLIDSILEQNNLYALHEYGDCYVAPHHGEGWGMPIHDAIFAHKNIITTRYGGITEMLDISNSNIIEHVMGPVKDMSWNPAYETGQNWAYPNIDHLKHLMRDVYENHDNEVHKMKRSLVGNIAKKTSIDAISSIIKKTL